MNVFVDTSALFALVDEDDDAHLRASTWLRSRGLDMTTELVTHSYVVVESASLVHRRLGQQHVRRLWERYVPAITVRYVDEQLHQTSAAVYLATLTRPSSLVDHVSFAFMRWEAITQAFAFDDDFAEAGFDLVA